MLFSVGVVPSCHNVSEPGPAITTTAGSYQQMSFCVNVWPRVDSVH